MPKTLRGLCVGIGTLLSLAENLLVKFDFTLHFCLSYDVMISIVNRVSWLTVNHC